MSEEEVTPEQEISIKDTLSYLKNSSSDLLKAKAELAALEAKEAAEVTVRKVVHGVLLAFFGIFTYILLLATIIGFGSHMLEGKLSSMEQYMPAWSIVTLGLLLIHLLFVFVFLDKIKSASKQTFFALTKAELEKDKQWLQQIKPNKES